MGMASLNITLWLPSELVSRNALTPCCCLCSSSGRPAKWFSTAIHTHYHLYTPPFIRTTIYTQRHSYALPFIHNAIHTHYHLYTPPFRQGISYPNSKPDRKHGSSTF